MRRRELLLASGALLAAPFAHAKLRGRVIRLGFLTSAFPTFQYAFWSPLVSSLEKYGWREGREIAVVGRAHFGDPVRARAMAREMVEEKVDLIVAITTLSAVAAKGATAGIPIAAWCGYPVESGLAKSLARPGGNVTGVANYAGDQVWAKFVELLRELRPELRELGVLWDYAPPGFPDGLVPLPVIEAAARRMGIRVRTWTIRSVQEFDVALSAIEKDPVEALILSQGGGLHAQPALGIRIAEVVTRRRIPAIVDFASTSVFEQARCVLAYSPNPSDIMDRLAHFVDRILSGANPATLPFELPARFELAVSAKSAALIGLAIPHSLLLRADRVIE